MHFVGMGAMSLRTPDGEIVPIYFSSFPTMMSLLAALICVYIGLFICSRDDLFLMNKEEIFTLILSETKSFHVLRDSFVVLKFVLTRNLLSLVYGGFIMGCGVVIMHYIGSTAMLMQARVEWDIGIIALSVIIALVASTAAFWILFRLLSLYPSYESLRLGSAIVMTIAVCSVHYTGMCAETYYLDESKPSPDSHPSSLSKDTASIMAIIASLIFNFVMNMVVQSELRSCHYRLLSFENILQHAIEDPRLKSENFATQYTARKKDYWKETNIPNRYRIFQDALRKSGQIVPQQETVSGTGYQAAPSAPGPIVDPFCDLPAHSHNENGEAPAQPFSFPIEGGV
jgi:NO-binding membrane sensor protein with MHYT domain